MAIRSATGIVPAGRYTKSRGIRWYSIGFDPFNNGLRLYRICPRALDLNFDVPDAAIIMLARNDEKPCGTNLPSLVCPQRNGGERRIVSEDICWFQ